mmetsp:Transcript_30454/g.43663  ORF Transcript_30454/g.43663 Transcript_30454/m.43663 type:complete len:439 (+) Transcript_30454:1588-2904(+)
MAESKASNADDPLNGTKEKENTKKPVFFILLISIIVMGIALVFAYLTFPTTDSSSKVAPNILEKKGQKSKYRPKGNDPYMNLHAFRAADEIYHSGHDGECWITTVQQMEDKGKLVDWGLQGVGDVLYLSFKGTDAELTDIITDLAIVYGTTKVGKEYFKIHLGFKNFVDEEYDDIINEIIRIQSDKGKYNFKKLCVTGHSLGGGVAQVFALRYLSKEHCTTADNCLWWSKKSLLPKLHYVPTFAAPMVLFDSSTDGPLYKKWREVCVNFIYQWDLVSFVPRAIPGILEHMKSASPYMDIVNAVVSYFKNDDSEMFQKSMAFAKNIISRVVATSNLRYLTFFKGISSNTVFFYNQQEDDPRDSSLITNYTYLMLNDEEVNNLALDAALHRFHGRNIENIVLHYHKLDSYKKALHLFNETVTNEVKNMKCSDTDNVWVPI